jgi:hypothetical protein
VKIAIHCNQFDGRSSGKATYDYGMGLRNLLNHEVVFITSLQNKNEGLPKLKSQFEVVTYDKPPIHNQFPSGQIETNHIIEKIIEENKVDFIHLIKSGQYDNIVPTNCRSGVHCWFLMNEPHGNIYAGLSEQIARKFGKVLYVPFIIKNCHPTKNLRKELNIPEDAMVIGRHGGYDTFNVSFVQESVKQILNFRNDIYFVFLATDKFYEHERIIYLPWTGVEQEIFNFIHSCDVMLHARSGGETFGSACGEFSVANKPVITWTGEGDTIYYDDCHIELLRDKAILYNNAQELMDILYSIDKSFIKNNEWDMYSNQFSEKNVINKYKEVFLS